MLTKRELLEFLQEDRVTEESAIPVYAKNLEALVYLAGFSEQEKKKMAGVLHVLSVESKRHDAMFLELIDEVERSNKDVY